jgi:hypothetical protein
MTGEELNDARRLIGNYFGEQISFADMARIVGLADPSDNGKDTIRKWEDGDGPSGPVATLVNLIVAGLDQSAPPDVRAFFDRCISQRLGLEPF